MQTKTTDPVSKPTKLTKTEQDFFKNNCRCAFGTDLEETQKKEDVAATIYCEEGEIKIWVNPDINAVDPNAPNNRIPFEKSVQAIHDKCITEHEKYHIEQMNFLCPGICKDVKGRRCLQMKDSTPVEGRLSCRNFSECWGNYVHLQCILTAYNDAKNKPGFTPTEKSQIAQLIAYEILNLKLYGCGDSGIVIPPELDPRPYLDPRLFPTIPTK